MKINVKCGGSTVVVISLVLLLNAQNLDGQCYTQEDNEECKMIIICIGSISNVRRDNCQQRNRYDQYQYSSYSYTYYITLEDFSSPDNLFRNEWIQDFRNVFQNWEFKSVVLRNNSLFISPLEGLVNYVKTEIFDLSQNFIKEFNIDSLREENTRNLASLNLSHNFISNLIGREVNSDHSYSYGSRVQRAGEFLQTLDLSYNTIKKLEDGIFSTFRRLERLDLSHNHLTSISFATFQGLDELKVLNVSFNFLTELNLALFELRKLEYLDISYNYFTIVYKQDLMNIAFLKVLNMQNNSLNSLHPDTFAPHTRLEQLNLSQNNFGDFLDDTMFKNNINLRIIDLSSIGMSNLVRNAFSSQNLEVFKITGNRLSVGLVQEYFNGLNRVTSLDLSHQYITSVGNNTFTGANSLELLDLSHNGIYVIEVKAFVSLVNLTSLDLSFNRLIIPDFQHADLVSLNILKINHNLIKDINNKTFEDFDVLEVLDISDNEIEHISANSLCLIGLRHLNLRNNTISKIDPNAFNGLMLISDLDMSYFNLSVILNNTFMGLKNVNNLNISNNQIQIIEGSAFVGLENLTNLDVSNNFLENFIVNTSHVPKLITLKLHNNRLRNIGTLNSLKHLQFLDLSNNKLSLYDNKLDSLMSIKEVILRNNSFTGDFFVPNSSELIVLDLTLNNIYAMEYSNDTRTNLRKIMLSSNKVKNITSLTLRNNPVLQEIDLSRNDIYDIETASFTGLTYLTTLDLGVNFVSILNPGMFIDLHVLEILNISHNRIREVKFGAFNGLKNLQILDLSFNEIVQIHKGIFFPLDLISSIVLDYNKMNTIEDLDSFSGSRLVISIGGNPLNCRWLGTLIQSYAKFEISTLRKNFTGENLDGITCVNKMEITDNSTNHFKISSNHTSTQYDIVPYVSNLTLLLEKLFSTNRSLAPSHSDVSLVPFLANATNLLEKILNKNYSLTVEKPNDENLKKYYEQMEIQNINIRDILDELKKRNNITEKNTRPELINRNTSAVITTSVPDRELIDKIDKLYSIAEDIKNSAYNIENEILNDFFQNISIYLGHNKWRQSGQPGSSESVSQAATDKLYAEAEPDKYATHIKLTEACVVIILIVMLAVIAYKAYLFRVLNTSSRLQSQSTQNIQMD